MPPLSQPIFTICMVLATAMVQLAAQLALDGTTRHLPRPRIGRFSGFHKATFTITAIAILMCGHLIQVAIWALRYYAWGELHGFPNSFYFSLASFTTLGASELELSHAHRFTGAIESALGMLMFGWSTALLIEIIQSVDRRRQ